MNYSVRSVRDDGTVRLYLLSGDRYVTFSAHTDSSGPVFIFKDERAPLVTLANEFEADVRSILRALLAELET